MNGNKLFDIDFKEIEFTKFSKTLIDGNHLNLSFSTNTVGFHIRVGLSSLQLHSKSGYDSRACRTLVNYNDPLDCIEDIRYAFITEDYNTLEQEFIMFVMQLYRNNIFDIEAIQQRLADMEKLV